MGPKDRYDMVNLCMELSKLNIVDYTQKKKFDRGSSTS